MTDRELLELAAKAAGINLHYADDDGRFPYDGVTQKDWNPLTDDGDALRLAVKLKFLVDVCLDQSEAGNSDGPYQCELHQNSDAYVATRRAIVRAAAEIGKTMESQNV